MARTALDENKIRETAYLLWLDEGQPAGRDEAHWHMAVDALTAPTPKKASRKTAAKKTAAAPKSADKPKAAAKAKAPAKKKATKAQ